MRRLDDLAVEVEVFQSAVGRMGIYASLGVPEVWRHDGERLTIHLLQPGGTFHAGGTSRAFPWLPIAAFVRFLDRLQGVDESTWIRRFRAWARGTLRPS